MRKFDDSTKSATGSIVKMMMNVASSATTSFQSAGASDIDGWRRSLAVTSWWSSIPPCATTRNLGCLRKLLDDDHQQTNSCRSLSVSLARSRPSGDHSSSTSILLDTGLTERHPVAGHATSPPLRIQRVFVGNVRHRPSSRQSQQSGAAPEAHAASQETMVEREMLTGPLAERKRHDRGPSRRVLLAREEKRRMFVSQAERYIGVPYREGSLPGTVRGDLWKDGLYLDCCGLVRKCLVDLCAQFGFMVGPWNQAYMFDTLPNKLSQEEMQPGDLVFVEGRYYEKHTRTPMHDIVHVEIWTGRGPNGRGTIGARRQGHAVEEHDDYEFTSARYEILAFHFRSIDTWLGGVCRSFCPSHPWRLGFSKKRRSGSRGGQAKDC